MRFDLTDLRLFLHVAEAGSITHGADRANMALASASARIRGMEEPLGVPLLERGRRGDRPTPPGQAPPPPAHGVLAQLERRGGGAGRFARGPERLEGVGEGDMEVASCDGEGGRRMM